MPGNAWRKRLPSANARPAIHMPCSPPRTSSGSEAAAEVDRLLAPVERARQLVEDLERRVREHEAATTAGDKANTEALIAALRDGVEAPATNLSEERISEMLGPELTTARTALAQLEAETKTARDLFERRTHGVSRAALAALTDRAIDEAVAITEAENELHRRRADLDALSQLLTAEARHLNGQAAPLPAQPVAAAIVRFMMSSFGPAVPAVRAALLMAGCAAAHLL
jgi:hypothetical protein